MVLCTLYCSGCAMPSPISVSEWTSCDLCPIVFGYCHTVRRRRAQKERNTGNVSSVLLARSDRRHRPLHLSISRSRVLHVTCLRRGAFSSPGAPLFHCMMYRVILYVKCNVVKVNKGNVRNCPISAIQVPYLLTC